MSLQIQYTPLLRFHFARLTNPMREQLRKSVLPTLGFGLPF